MSDTVKKIRIEDYNYPLPQDKIAQYPLPKRDTSKLLTYQNGEIGETIYSELPEVLPNDTFLVFNQTKVVQARLYFQKNETTTIELFCLGPIPPMDTQQAMGTISSIQYQCMVGGARKWKRGELVLQTESGTNLSVAKLENHNGVFTIEFKWDSNQTFAEILEEVGQTPLPPYLNRKAEQKDKRTYQTVFAQNNGSVAAPTAGLHFTDELLENLEVKGIKKSFLTLHVGSGTFKPVSADEISEHDMHAEEFIIELSFLNELLDNIDRAVIPVGTTSMRALESIYWLGVKLLSLPDLNNLHVEQWIAYAWPDDLPSPKEAIEALRGHILSSSTDFLLASTSIIIAPGYQHQICNGLLTNFHQPKSTLLLLVASLIGEKWKSVYDYALHHGFRFLSYGDGCLLMRD